MRPRQALCRIGIGAALSLGFCPAQGASAGPPPAPAVSAKPALPESGRIGRIKRDAAGHIVPDGPPPAAEPRPHGGSPALFGGPGDTVGLPPPRPVPQLSTFDPQALGLVQRRADHEMQARKLQFEIDRIVRQAHDARTRGAPVDGNGRTAAEEKLLGDLARIDRAVRAHEMQHYLAAQPYARMPEYFYVVGPDGGRFAVSGITAFDASPIAGDDEATARKLDTLVRAALAPREPSEEDRRVAATLERLIALLRQNGSAARSSTPRPDGRR